MKQKINKSLATLSIIVALICTVFLTLVYYGLLQKQIYNDLRIEASLLENMNVNQIKSLTDNVNKKEIRITIIEPDGTVLFDNDVNADELSNHLDRPEVKEAIVHGEGTAERKSDTLNHTNYYLALRVDNGMIIRVSREARSIENLLLSSLPIVTGIVLIIIIASIAFSKLLTKQLLEPLNNIADNLDNIPSSSEYSELNPFINKIRIQHEDILTAAKSRQDFTANVSHELKTPLTAISGYAELIENRMVDEKQTIHFAGEIRENSDRLVSLINDIIRLSELDHMDSKVNFEKIDIYEIAQERMEMYQTNANKKNVRVILDGNHCEALSNKNLFIELLDNLVDNAIKYNVNSGEVIINIFEKADKIKIIVSDTGIGIPTDSQKRVFERFYRVDKSRSKEIGGTGLGLAIVKHIVEIHEGTIHLSSEVGKGTRIEVTI